MAIVDGRDAQLLNAAAAALAAGELVAFPTETVYGLGARADDDAAVARIFAAKGRPVEHPLIVHVSGIQQALRFAASLAGPAHKLAQAFWPGPVTVIVPRRPGLAKAAAGGQASIGLRCPSHPVARALMECCAALGVAGIAAPSANRFGRISPTTAAHVADEFGTELRVLDGGACSLGIESAIVDCSRGRPVLLRPGVLTRAELEEALGEPLFDALEGHHGPAPRASGSLESHYAPRARLGLMDAASLARMTGTGRGMAVYSRTRPAGLAAARWVKMPSGPAEVAHELFAVLRTLDAAGITQIWVEQAWVEQAWVERVSPAPEWEGVRDRLTRAAAG